MLAYAEHHFRMNKTDEHGVRYVDHLDQIEASTGKRPEDAIPPETPDVGLYLFEWFLDLSRGRSANLGMGVYTLDYQTVKAWVDLRRIEVYTWEIDALLRLDSAWVRIMTEDKKRG